MPKSSFLDELLELLPTVGLKVWMIDQTDEGWHAALYDPLHPMDSRVEAEGGTAAQAVTKALSVAGVAIDE